MKKYLQAPPQSTVFNRKLVIARNCEEWLALTKHQHREFADTAPF